MKLVKKIFTLNFLLFFVWGIAQEITIKGKITDSPDPDVTINLPVDGKYFSGNNKTLNLDSEDHFSFSTTIKEPSFVSITNDFKTVVLYAEPNKSYEVDFHNSGIEYKGETAEKQNFLNDLGLYLDARSTVDPEAFTKLSDKEAFYTSWYQKRVDKLDKALAQEIISEEEYNLFLNLLKLKVADFKSADYYFTYRLMYENDEVKRAEFNNDYLAAWQKLYKDAFNNPNYDKYLPLTAFIDRMKGFNDIKETNFLSFDTDNLPYRIYQINYFKDKLPQSFLEYDWANRIYLGIQDNNFEVEWLDNYAEFQKTYPNSKLSPILKPYITKVQDFHSDKEEVTYVDNYENINSLGDLFNQLKGQVVYVDMWATWCGPCRQELQFSKKNHEKLKEMGILPLYLSVDMDRDDNAWKEMIKKLGLNGLHMRSNSQLKSEIDDKLKQGIPYYIIVGKDGEVKVWGAKRPSDQKLLFEQLEQYL